MDNEDTKTERPRVFFYRGTLPPALGLLLLAPLLCLFLSVAVAALAGGTLAAFVLPLLLGRRAGRNADDRPITLEPGQYSRIDADRRQLPPR